MLATVLLSTRDDMSQQNSDERLERVITVPNMLTALRLACLPAFVALLAEPHGEGRLAAAFLLGGLGTTDGLDGYIARHFHQVSALGKVADPLVDRLLVLSATIGALAVGAAPPWLVGLALAREALVLLAAGVLAAAGARRLEVSLVGKAGAFGMMVALPLFFLGHAMFYWHSTALWAAWVAAAWGLALGWSAFFMYLPQGLAALRSARRRQGRA
jgi:cardiolipin synthase